MTKRREFIKTASFTVLAGTAMFPRLGQAGGVSVQDLITEADLRELATKAIDAALAAGATYADVRLTVTRLQQFYYANPPMENESIAVGVRALASGAWGFTSGADWTIAAMEKLGTEAAGQAKGNAWAGVSPIELSPLKGSPKGNWKMPVKRDPFDVSVEEKLDFIKSAEAYAATFRHGGASSIIEFERQVKVFASSEGAFFTQTTYNTLGGRSGFSVGVRDPLTGRNAGLPVEFVSPTGTGYEIFEDSKLLDQIPRLYEESLRMLKSEPIIPSRYELVMDGFALAPIVNETIAQALEVDRAIGYEANAGGTSYLAPLEDVLGKPFGPKFLSITANRSQALGAATVKWDDDGVEPSDFDLVRNGEVVGYSTTREHAHNMKSWNDSKGLPTQSNGCAGAQDGLFVPIVQTPNVRMQPGAEDKSFLDLVAGVEDGIAVRGGTANTDFQKLNGQGMPAIMYRIRKGKLAEVVHGGGYWFRGPELWKDLLAIGGKSSLCSRGVTSEKGQPVQNSVNTVEAVAAHFKNIRVVDVAGTTNSNKVGF